MDRNKATITEGIIAIVVGIIVCLGYNKFYFELPLPNGSTGQILDILDYFSNSIMMPIIALLTCILVGYVIKPEAIITEVTKNGEKFSRKKLYTIMVKYIAPIFLFILLLRSFGLFN